MAQVVLPVVLVVPVVLPVGVVPVVSLHLIGKGQVAVRVAHRLHRVAHPVVHLVVPVVLPAVPAAVAVVPVLVPVVAAILLEHLVALEVSHHAGGSLSAPSVKNSTIWKPRQWAVCAYLAETVMLCAYPAGRV